MIQNWRTQFQFVYFNIAFEQSKLPFPTTELSLRKYHSCIIDRAAVVWARSLGIYGDPIRYSYLRVLRVCSSDVPFRRDRPIDTKPTVFKLR